MRDGVLLRPVFELPDDFDILRAEAAGSGFGFLDRLGRDWRSGDNRFDRPGEQLVGAFARSALVAIGGLNRDPYADGANVGRLRHLYVLKAWRSAGVGRFLVERLMRHAEGAFSEVRLRTDTDDAAAFYRRCGFAAVESASASHTRAV